MVNALRKIYFRVLLPPVVGLGLCYAADKTGLISFDCRSDQHFTGRLIFIASAICAIALPIFLRTWFSHKVRDQKAVSRDALFCFERRLICVSLAALYFLIPACLLEIASFYFGGTILMSLYAAYYFFPSEKRIRFERKVFRVP